MTMMLRVFYVLICNFHVLYSEASLQIFLPIFSNWTICAVSIITSKSQGRKATRYSDGKIKRIKEREGGQQETRIWQDVLRCRFPFVHETSSSWTLSGCSVRLDWGHSACLLMSSRLIHTNTMDTVLVLGSPQSTRRQDFHAGSSSVTWSQGAGWGSRNVSGKRKQSQAVCGWGCRCRQQGSVLAGLQRVSPRSGPKRTLTSGSWWHELPCTSRSHTG